MADWDALVGLAERWQARPLVGWLARNQRVREQIARRDPAASRCRLVCSSLGLPRQLLKHERRSEVFARIHGEQRILTYARRPTVEAAVCSAAAGAVWTQVTPSKMVKVAVVHADGASHVAIALRGTWTKRLSLPEVDVFYTAVDNYFLFGATAG